MKIFPSSYPTVCILGHGEEQQQEQQYEAEDNTQGEEGEREAPQAEVQQFSFW